MASACISAVPIARSALCSKVNLASRSMSVDRIPALWAANLYSAPTVCKASWGGCTEAQKPPPRPKSGSSCPAGREAINKQAGQKEISAN